MMQRGCPFGGGLAASGWALDAPVGGVRASASSRAKSTLLRIGLRVTGHPRMVAVQEPWLLCGNHREISAVAQSGSCAGTLRLLSGNHCGISVERLCGRGDGLRWHLWRVRARCFAPDERHSIPRWVVQGNPAGTLEAALAHQADSGAEVPWGTLRIRADTRAGMEVRAWRRRTKKT
jgi:hypothetical protein